MNLSQEEFESEIKKLKSDNDILRDVVKNMEKQVKELEDIIKNQNLTIKSLQETVVSSQVYKIPQYQKTIAFLNDSVAKLQEENESLKKMILKKDAA